MVEDRHGSNEMEQQGLSAALGMKLPFITTKTYCLHSRKQTCQIVDTICLFAFQGQNLFKWTLQACGKSVCNVFFIQMLKSC
jgi:hypothetical protein